MSPNLVSYKHFEAGGAVEWLTDYEQLESDILWFDDLSVKEAVRVVTEICRVDSRSALDLAVLAEWTSDTPQGLDRQDEVFAVIDDYVFDGVRAFGGYSTQEVLDNFKDLISGNKIVNN